MFEPIKCSPGRRLRDKTTALILTGMVLFGAVVMVSPATASAGAASNTFTFKGAYSGTLKLTPSSFNCSFGKAYSGKGFLVTLSHMKGTITGAGKGAWAFGAYPSKKGTTHVGAANVKSLTDASFQSSGLIVVASNCITPISPQE